MSQTVLRRALPFYPTKRSGTGLVGAGARNRQAHGGRIQLANREGGGLRHSGFAADVALIGRRRSQSKSVASSGCSACWNMRSICAAVVLPSDSGGSASRAKKATSLVSSLGRAAPPVISQMKNIL